MERIKDKTNRIVFAAALVALFFFVAIAYAQESRNMMGQEGMMDMAGMMAGNGMDEMHKQMTKNLDPELKGQMDRMHEQCIKLHQGSDI